MTIHKDIRFFDMFSGIGVLMIKEATKSGCKPAHPGDSDTQAHKQAGNAVTVNVVHALGLRLKAAHAAAVAATGAEKEAA